MISSEKYRTFRDHALEGELLLVGHNFKVRRLRLGAVALSAVAVAAIVSGCSPTSSLNPRQTLTQGYVADPKAIELVPVGSSREQVLLALGTPSTTATFDSEVFYYVSQLRVRPVAFMNPKLVDQRILAVYFGEDGRVTNIANYGLQDGKVFDFISRTTPTGGKDQTFIGQLLSGLGGGGAQTARGLFGGGG
jgi:outer membrane protein assembly factor BamE (lipoprotein component of BamABCDE complex)